MTVSGLNAGLLLVTLVVAVVFDLRSRTIPDWLTFPAAGLALAVRFGLELFGDFNTGLVSGLLGLLVATGWFAVFAARGQLGWGDVKLAAVMGGCLGLSRTLPAVVFISLAGAFQAIVSLLWKGRLSATVRGVLTRGGEKGDAVKAHIPYGVAIALGSIGAMWWDGTIF